VVWKSVVESCFCSSLVFVNFPSLALLFPQEDMKGSCVTAVSLTTLALALLVLPGNLMIHAANACAMAIGRAILVSCVCWTAATAS
jgi:hypothetical protein